MWLVRRKPIAEPSARLLCLPYAGGAAVFFESWAAHVPPDIELTAVELPGRGRRFSEPPYREFAPLLDALRAEVAVGSGTILFGHSLGALLAFELARRCEPRALVVSGCGAPHRPREQRSRSGLADAPLVEEIASLGGTPRELLDNAELMELLLPVLRADFSVSESYRYRPGPPLGCRIVALGGDADDDVSEQDIAAWSELTTDRFRMRVFAGDHFFIRQHEREVVSWLLHEALA
jgi:medium-chain acyl-[acyl-carrier-protein] hydrolase